MGVTQSTDGDISNNHNNESGKFSARDALLINLDLDSGELKRTKCYGGTGDDIFSNLMVTDNNTLLIAGYTYSCNGDLEGINFFAGDSSRYFDYKGWIVELTQEGIQKKATVYNSNPILRESKFRSIHKDNSGFILCGSVVSNGPEDILTIQVDSTLEVISSQQFGGALYDYGVDCFKHDNGDYFLVGHTNSNNSGDILGNHWTDTIGPVISSRQDVWIAKLKMFQVGIDSYGPINPRLNLYPNPAHKTMNIEFGNVNCKYHVFNETGQEIKTNYLVQGCTNMDVSDWSNGAYYLNLEYGTAIYTYKFIVLHYPY